MEARHRPFRDDRRRLSCLCSKIACGARHSLALSEDGHVYSWGWSLHGQCASQKPVSEVARCEALVGLNVISIAGGLGHSLACTDCGDVYRYVFMLENQSTSLFLPLCCFSLVLPSSAHQPYVLCHDCFCFTAKMHFKLKLACKLTPCINSRAQDYKITYPFSLHAHSVCVDQVSVLSLSKTSQTSSPARWRIPSFLGVTEPLCMFFVDWEHLG